MNWTPKPYINLKREMLAQGLFSCSQVGFNIAMGPLARLRGALAGMLCRVFSADERWEVPPFIRADWIPRGCWANPSESQWMTAQPTGHVLTPLPSMHLLNRLRHHPATGVVHLSGWCARQEEDTLPLLRQLAFTVHECVHIGDSPGAAAKADEVWSRLMAAARSLELPVREAHNAETGDARLLLVLPETPEVPLAMLRKFPKQLLADYRMEWASAGSVACGIERWCLALIARWGVDHVNWPDLGSESTAG